MAGLHVAVGVLFSSMLAGSVAGSRRVPVPYFLDTPVDVTAARGSDVILPCAVEDLGTKTVVWRNMNDTTPLTVGEFVYDDDPRYSVVRPHSSDWNLRIADVRPEDAGTYVCQITSTERKTRYVTLNVTGSVAGPRRVPVTYFLDTPVKVYTGRGYDVILRCAVQNLGPKMVVWRKMNETYPLTIGEFVYADDPRYSVVRPYSSDWNLRIADVRPEDAGTYECQISSTEYNARNVTLIVRPATDTPDDWGFL